MQIEIGVRRLDAGEGDWVMVPAQEFVANIYLILDHDIESEQGFALEFKPGDMVTAMEWPDDKGGRFLGAIRLYGGLPF